MNDRDNAAWLDALRASDEEAVGDLRTALRLRLGRALGKRGVDDNDLEDFAQEAVLRVLDRLDRFRGDSAFLTWATAVSVRVAFTHLRRRRAPQAPIDEIVPPVAAAPAPGAALEREEVLTALRRAIDQALTERQRTVILGELAGVTPDQLAEQLGSKRNAIYKVYHDARKKLGAALEAAGFHGEDVRRALLTASNQPRTP